MVVQVSLACMHAFMMEICCSLHRMPCTVHDMHRWVEIVAVEKNKIWAVSGHLAAWVR